MAKPARIDRPIKKNLSLPESLVTKVDLLLYNSVENKVPFGAWQELVTRLLNEWLSTQQGVQQ